LAFCVLFFTEQLDAQCSSSGFVLSKDSKCGVQILDTQSGEVFWAPEGGMNLSVGQLCSYDKVPFSGQTTCSQDPASLFSLTCASLSVPCSAQFIYQQDVVDALHFKFDANLTDPINQVCTWDFGDGATETGINQLHTYQAPGQYQVCLTVTDPNSGCFDQKCELIDVTSINLSTCGKQAYITSMDLNLMGELTDLSHGESQLISIDWTIHKNGPSISDQSSFSFPLPQYGEYTVCADYQTLLLNGNSCVAKDCKVLSAIPIGCTNSVLASSDVICPPVVTPVCGCDGITYGSECDAMANGITSFWIGTCANAGNTGCTANFAYEYISGSLTDGFWVRFHNLSTGYYTKSVLDFGDGSPVFEPISWDTVSHHYIDAGLFLANFTIWKSDTAVNSISKVVFTDAQSMASTAMPSLGFVWPGDTDASKKANVNDLLNLGLGYFTEGIPRPSASINWEPQIAPNWDRSTITGVNYKHLDSDGNGKVNELDASPIQLYYQKLDSSPVVYADTKPEVAIRFAQDTILVDPNQQAIVDITGELYIGKSINPVQNLYGFALALEYPEYVNQNTIAFYTGEQFFGQSNSILWLQKNHYGAKQLDLGFVRKNQAGVSGHGRVAQVNIQSDIIIIIDLIERQAAPIPFVIKINSLKAIDSEGNLLELTVPQHQDTLWIKMNPTTSSQEVLDVHTKVYPNPVHHDLNLLLPAYIEADQIQITDAMGRKVRTINEPQKNGGIYTITMSDMPQGVYQAQIFTNKGLITKEIVKL
jgi:PKD repeat protein